MERYWVLIFTFPAKSSGSDRIRIPNTASEVLALPPMLGIRDILVRIRIRGSVPLTNGSGLISGSDSFLQ